MHPISRQVVYLALEEPVAPVGWPPSAHLYSFEDLQTTV